MAILDSTQRSTNSLPNEAVAKVVKGEDYQGINKSYGVGLFIIQYTYSVLDSE